MAGCGIWLYQFLIIAYLFTLNGENEFIVAEKRWRPHFPHSKSMGMLKDEKLRSENSDLAKCRIYPKFYARRRYLQVWQRSD